MSIYDSIGGAESVRAAVEQFYTRVLADPALGHFFAGVDIDRLKSHQRSFIAAALGGRNSSPGGTWPPPTPG